MRQYALHLIQYDCPEHIRRAQSSYMPLLGKMHLNEM
jgi:hypothetical protein